MFQICFLRLLWKYVVYLIKNSLSWLCTETVYVIYVCCLIAHLQGFDKVPDIK